MNGGTTFGCCNTHGDYCGNSCPFCKIDIIKETLRKLGYDYVKHMKEEHTYIIPLNIEKSLEKLDDKTDCVGICGFCEIKDTCNNPKRLKQTEKKEDKIHTFTNPNFAPQYEKIIFNETKNTIEGFPKVLETEKKEGCKRWFKKLRRRE